MGEQREYICVILILIVFAVSVSGCTSSSSGEKNNDEAPKVTLSNFTAKGVTFQYPSDSWTCVEGSGNTIAELTYKNGDAKAYVQKYPGKSLEELKSLISMEPHTTNKETTKTYAGYNAEYSGYTIDGKPKPSFNQTEYTKIFEVGNTSYRVTVESKSSMSYVVMYISNSIRII